VYCSVLVEKCVLILADNSKAGGGWKHESGSFFDKMRVGFRMNTVHQKLKFHYIMFRIKIQDICDGWRKDSENPSNITTTHLVVNR
jgi:hypothetical protein